MSNVVAFSAQASASASKAVSRLNEIWKAVEAFTLEMQYERVTPAEMMRVLRIFNTANSCIRIVLSEFKNDPAIDELVGHSREIARMIEEARRTVASLMKASDDRASRPEPSAAKRLGD
ncbi:hypothetical protein KUL72_04195 [Bradyrhizobium arachidis]|uniref:hypothetical protein n=1 Tax=Bradyrhizobium arachidis TaxID=858423 RepID=UPI0021631EF5|nr:hypothetical protein [Bradyrhizobium arachidis]UVO37602.1 hypothetical protein KUL72_04195 [Bradyrhizobium arachidis]